MDFEQIIREKGKCCISGRSLFDSHCNLVIVDYAPTWAYPKETNLLIPDSPTRAIAVVHDDCVTSGMKHMLTDKIKFAIELRGEEIIYHAVEDLQPIFYPAKN